MKTDIRWSNIPLPEGRLILLLAGAALHTRIPLKLFNKPLWKHFLGWSLLLFGSLLAAWAVITIKDMDISRPSRITVSGPYRFSRNPMYVAWTLIYAGVAVLLNTWWLLILLPVLLAFTHYYVVLREEQQLEQEFGEEYRRYRDRVGRYLTRWRQTTSSTNS